MSGLICKYLVCISILFPVLLNAQNNYSAKKVNLPSGHITFKATLKLLSDQTGCVFSYDPTKIVVKQELIIPECKNLMLQTALQRILPQSIQFKFYGKYIVLQKKDLIKIETPQKIQSSKPKIVTIKDETVVKTPEYKKHDSIVPVKDINEGTHIDSVNQVVKYIRINPVLVTMVESDSVLLPHSVLNSEFQLVPINNPDTTLISKPKYTPVFELELSGNNHLGTLSTHIGFNHLYSIFSVASDYNKTYHSGFGVGVNIKLIKKLDANIDLVRYALIAGRSYRIKVRAATTELSPKLSYSIGQKLKLLAGSSVYLIKSKYINGTSTVGLNNYIGYSAILGIKIDII